MNKTIRFILSVAFLTGSISEANTAPDSSRQEKAHHKTTQNEKRAVAKQVLPSSEPIEPNQVMPRTTPPMNQQYGDPNRDSQKMNAEHSLIDQSRMNDRLLNSPTPMVTPTAFPTGTPYSRR